MSLSSKCHLIAVTGGKGGVGKSVFTSNFAMTILLELRKRVLVIDLDANSCGDQNVILGVRPQKTVGDLCTYTGQINPQTIQNLVNKHPSGMHYLAAIKSPDELLSPPTDVFVKQLSQLSNAYDYILVDVGTDIQEAQAAMLDLASACFLVCTPEVLALNQSKRLLSDLLAQTIPAELFYIVANKVNKAGINPQLISQQLKRPLMGQIPQDDITTAAALQRSTPFVNPQGKTPVANAYKLLLKNLMGSGVLQKMKAFQKPKRKPAKNNNVATENLNFEEDDPRNLLKLKIHHGLIEEMDLKKGITDTKGDPAKEAALRKQTQQIITKLIDSEGSEFSRDERAKIIKEVLDEALALGPLEDLLEDEDVSEIMVNGPKKIFIEKKGKLSLSKTTFTGHLQLKNVIQRIVTPLGRRIDEKTPYVDARLADGSRVNAVMEPIAIDGACITIRKFKKEKVTAKHYVQWGSMTESMIDFLRICVENGLNIVISGGTGSGKTTLLNTLSNFIPSTERIITIEDAAELQLGQEHVVRLETRPPNMEGTGAISIRDLVMNALRMRPERIVVGECRGGEALDMLQAMNTGHDGSMTTTHANSPKEGVARIETLCMMADAGLPAKAIREQIAGAVDLIIQVNRLSDGSRKITSITEVVGMQGETITLQEIFRFKETGFDKNRRIIGQFQPMGLIPTFIEEFERKGIKVPRTLFTSSPQQKTDPQVKPTKKVSGGNR
ncbi:MAG: ATPase, T2SS/T4P/T4SS family [Bdellovibrionales bacterium]